MAKLSVKWQRIASGDAIRRSSQVIGIANGQLSIFGGELKPREPVDGSVSKVDLRGGSNSITTSPSTSSSPPPRVGAAATTIAGTTYVFSGRGGEAMMPLSENGTLWAYSQSGWEPIHPAYASAPVPPPRSYHTMTNDGRDAIYLHAGCPEKGRLNDLWVFQISSRRWVHLASAPGPERGGSSVAFCGSADLLFRMNGFDGSREVGGSVDVYNPESDCWTAKTYAADGNEGPEARSVGSLVCIRAKGTDYLITAFGERDPSSLGHQGAGKMLGDVWAWGIERESWTRVQVQGDARPQPRGWFAAEVLGEDGIVVQGGLAEDNSRLGDVWVGKLSVVD